MYISIGILFAFIISLSVFAYSSFYVFNFKSMIPIEMYIYINIFIPACLLAGCLAWNGYESNKYTSSNFVALSHAFSFRQIDTHIDTRTLICINVMEFFVMFIYIYT